MADDEIYLNQFLDDQAASLLAFKHWYWDLKRMHGPNMPMRMSKADWYKQYLSWLETK